MTETIFFTVESRGSRSPSVTLYSVEAGIPVCSASSFTVMFLRSSSSFNAVVKSVSKILFENILSFKWCFKGYNYYYKVN